MADKYRVSFTYSTSIARRVYLRMLWEFRNGLVVTTPIFLFLAVRGIALDENVSLCWFAVGAVATLWSSWWLTYVRVGRARNLVASREATVVLGDETCSFQSAQVETTVQWSAIGRLYRFRKEWILVRVGGLQALFVPAESLSTEARQFVIDKVRAVGGHVV
jgi:hypothetical protein